MENWEQRREVHRMVQARDAADRKQADPHCPHCGGSGQRPLIWDAADYQAGIIEDRSMIGEEGGKYRCDCIPN